MNARRLRRIRHKDLEDVESLELYRLGWVLQQDHVYLQMPLVAHIFDHHFLEVLVQQHLGQQLLRLPFSDVLPGLQQSMVSLKKLLKVRLEPRRGHRLVREKNLAESVEGVRGDVDTRVLRVENQLGHEATLEKRLHQFPVPRARAENNTVVERDLLICMAAHEQLKDRWVVPQVLDDLAIDLLRHARPKKGATYVHHVLPRLELQDFKLPEKLRR
mmetsp:Transcript_118368/g.342215  ORF Transcript_118368/g.342215 Transcript_118368/m.342215 type:complete len:216 (-) Transcript_118368:673-1320(-)